MSRTAAICAGMIHEKICEIAGPDLAEHLRNKIGRSMRAAHAHGWTDNQVEGMGDRILDMIIGDDRRRLIGLVPGHPDAVRYYLAYCMKESPDA